MILCSIRLAAVAVIMSSWIRIFSAMISAVLAMILTNSPPLFRAARNTSEKLWISSRPLLLAKVPQGLPESPVHPGLGEDQAQLLGYHRILPIKPVHFLQCSGKGIFHRIPCVESGGSRKDRILELEL